MIDEIVGWRVWKADWTSHSLISPRMGSVWPKTGDGLMAECYSGGHSTPGPDKICRCGLWATRYAPPFFGPILGPILGLVRLWGDVAVHGQEGWRAKFARPIALVNHDFEIEKQIERIADEYAIPVIDLQRPGWRALVRELGAPSIGWIGPPIHRVMSLPSNLYRVITNDSLIGGKEGITIYCTCGWGQVGSREEMKQLRLQHYKQLEQPHKIGC